MDNLQFTQEELEAPTIILTEDDNVEMVEFTVSGEPFGKERPRFKRAGMYVKTFTPDKTVGYENYIKLMYCNIARGRMFEKGCPLKMDIMAYYSIPKNTSKKKTGRMLEGIERPSKKPDWDNIAKIVCDSLNKTAYHDDAVIVEASVKKYYAEIPRVHIRIQKIHTENI